MNRYLKLFGRFLCLSDSNISNKGKLCRYIFVEILNPTNFINKKWWSAYIIALLSS